MKKHNNNHKKIILSLFFMLTLMPHNKTTAYPVQIEAALPTLVSGLGLGGVYLVTDLIKNANKKKKMHFMLQSTTGIAFILASGLFLLSPMERQEQLQDLLARFTSKKSD